MHPKATDKTSSPPKPSSTTARIEDGKIKKPRAQSKSDITAVQHINGKTYACESCKRGHRVHKCDHGRTRPISETNQPGRPSGGQKRGCQCPRNCACTSKTCKCQRDCSCTQEMFVIVRVEAPQPQINRDSTSTPKPIWEDANGNKMTLKKVWADANGKQINEQEYQERKRKLREREEGIVTTPLSPSSSTPETKSCCAAKPAKQEPQSPALPDDIPSASGCRHRQNLSTMPSSDPPTADSLLLPPKRSSDLWTTTCTCGSGCSCLYCPEHPNNATSVNHTQLQVKNFAEHAYAAQGFSLDTQFMPQSDSRSCMGGRQTFFLSRTPNVSHQQLQQFFSESDPSAIYLTYPIQQHSWTNQPLSAHCSHSHSPSASITMTPEPTDSNFLDPAADFSSSAIPWELLPDDSNGTWNFSDGQLGTNGFSWMDVDASRGTDYHVGQATVASSTNPMALQVPQPTSGAQLSSSGVNFDLILQNSLGIPQTTLPQYNSVNGPMNDAYMTFPPSNFAATSSRSMHPLDLNMNVTQLQQSSHHISTTAAAIPGSAYQSQIDPPAIHSCCGGHGSNHGLTTYQPWNDLDSFDNAPSDLRSSINIPNSPPILNGA